MNSKVSRVINLEVDRETLLNIQAICRDNRCNFDQLVCSLLSDYVSEQSWRLDESDRQAA